MTRYRVVNIHNQTLCRVATAQQAADVILNLGPVLGAKRYMSQDTRPGTVYPFTVYKQETVGWVGTPFKTFEEAAIFLERA